MGKTFNEEDGLTYTEFFAHHKTIGRDIDNLRDSDCCSSLLENIILLTHQTVGLE